VLFRSRLVVNPAALKLKRQALRTLIDGFTAAVQAQDQGQGVKVAA